MYRCYTSAAMSSGGLPQQAQHSTATTMHMATTTTSRGRMAIYLMTAHFHPPQLPLLLSLARLFFAAAIR